MMSIDLLANIIFTMIPFILFVKIKPKPLAFLNPLMTIILTLQTITTMRRYGQRTYERYTSGQTAGLIPSELVNKYTIVVYPSSDDEYRFLVDNSEYDCVDQITEITCIVETLLRDRPEMMVCIRMHPNMAEMHPDIMNSYSVLDSYPNVYLCLPLDNYDTYALMDHASVVVAFCSSIIAEAAYARKNIVN